MEANQLILFEHYTKLSVEGKTPKIRESGKERAEELLKSYPHFKKQEPKPEPKPEKKEKKK